MPSISQIKQIRQLRRELQRGKCIWTESAVAIAQSLIEADERHPYWRAYLLSVRPAEDSDAQLADVRHAESGESIVSTSPSVCEDVWELWIVVALSRSQSQYLDRWYCVELISPFEPTALSEVLRAKQIRSGTSDYMAGAIRSIEIDLELMHVID